MPNEMNARAEKFKQQRSKKRKVYTALTALALVVGLGTAWALAQPASAMAGKLICGMEEHTHTDECYERSLVCGLEEGEEHTHTDDCWQTELVCQLAEHTHTEECYAKPEPESKPESQPAETEGVTSQPESSAESESESNSAEETEKPESQPEADKDADKSEAAQPESKPETDKKPDASQPESENADDSSVSKPDTDLEETDSEQPEEETEPEEEQQDTDKFLPLIPYLDQLPKEIPAEYSDLRMAEISEGGQVRVYARPGTLPENVEIKAHLLSEESAEFAQAVQRLQEAGVQYDFVTALDISLYNELGEKVEPEAPVYVEIEAAGLISREADPATIQIQHHKEILPQVQQQENAEEADMAELLQNAEPEVVLETVVDQEKGLLTQQPEQSSFAATFPVDSFSIYTITSEGWKDLYIKVHCVDEVGEEIPIAPKDIVLNDKHTSGSNFGIDFSLPNDSNLKIPGYQFDKKAYYMKEGHYDKRIYGLRHEGSTWYYMPKVTSGGKPDLSKKVAFDPQPNFSRDENADSIRLIYKKILEIPVLYVDDDVNGSNPLPDSDSPGGKNTATLTFIGNELDIGNVDLLPVCDAYFYVGKAFVGDPIPANEVFTVIRKEGIAHAVTADNREIPLSEENPLKLVYHKTQTGTPGRIETVSTKEKGLTINLFDYNSGQNYGPKEGINNGRDLQFVLDSSRPEDYNKWTGPDGGIYTGIVQEKLKDGYPVMKGGQSLDYLFDPEICKSNLHTTVDHVHTNLDHLFWRDKDGYYCYNSMTNFATIMDEAPDGSGGHNPDHMDGGNFIVYEQPALPESNALGDNPKFLPFNTYAQANQPTKKPAKDEKIKQYHFGMTMEAEFLIPPGGEVVDAEGNHVGLRDMIFEFNGDDDVWVFIDGKLALDLGGIHDRYGGSINFRTGEITTDAPPMEHSGRRQPNLYGIESGANTMSPEQLAAARAKAGFGDYSEHNFKFFYLERGRGASNCAIRFNLVPVSHRLVVGKRLPENGGVKSTVSPTDHMWYKFRAQTAMPHGESAAEGRKPLANAPFMVLKWDPNADAATGGLPIRPGVTDENGYFWLRADERAQFTDVIDLRNAGNIGGHEDDVHIYVSEIVPENNVLRSVRAWTGRADKEGTYQEVTDQVTGKVRKVAPPLYDAPGKPFHTDKTEVSLNPMGSGEVAYEVEMHCGRHNEFNWVDFENDLGEPASLNITKKALRETQSGEYVPIDTVPFTIKVELWDTLRNDWVPLSEGSPYWILQSGEESPAPGVQPTDHLKKGADGQIQIYNEQTIHFKLLPGTKYKVTEILSPEDKVLYTTDYSGLVKIDDEPVWDEDVIVQYNDGIGSAEGVVAGSVHKIKVINRSDVVIAPKGTFTLTKQVTGTVPEGSDDKFHFELGINGYQPDESGTDQPIMCKATYHDTPSDKAVWRDDCTPQGELWVQNISFKKDQDGKWGANLFLYPGETVVITGLPEGVSVSVKEVLSQEQNGKYDVTFQEDGQNAVQGTQLDGTVATIDNNRVVKVTCVNASKVKSTNTLKITKQVKRTDRADGEPTVMDRIKEFDFSITLKDPVGFAGGANNVELPAELQTSEGPKEVTVQFEKSGSDYIAKLVKLKHGETLTIPDLPMNIDVVVQENNHEGYAASMNRKPGDSITVHLAPTTGKADEVLCINMTGVKLPETGGSGHLPYYLFGTLMLCAAGWLLYRRRKGAENR